MDRQLRKSNATRRNHQVYIQSKTGADDNHGGVVETWVDSVGPVWASVDPIRANKVFEYRSSNVHATHLIGMSARINVNETNRIRFGTRFFEITAVENLQERNVDLVITANEVRA